MNTSDLRLFIRIAETGSITQTAKQLSLTPPAVSAALKRLEQDLKLQLFIRTTRQLRITPQGEQFLYHCRQALALLEQGQIAAQQSLGKIAGNLRLSVPSDLGRNLLPWIDELLDEHTELSIDLHVGDTVSNFFAEQVDVALRYGKPADSGMVSFHIASLPRVTCAAPEYLRANGMPVHPAELLQHQCLLYRRDGQLFSQWLFSDGGKPLPIKVQGKRVSNDTEIVKRWALAAKGVMHRALLDISTELQQGLLQPILTEFESPRVELHLICPNRNQVSPAVIELRERLRAKTAEIVKNAGEFVAQY